MVLRLKTLLFLLPILLSGCKSISNIKEVNTAAALNQVLPGNHNKKETENPAIAAASLEIQHAARPSSGPTKALGHYIKAAKFLLPEAIGSSPQIEARNLYNEVCSQSAKLVYQIHKKSGSVPITIEDVRFSFVDAPKAGLLDQDSVVPCSQVLVKGLLPEVKAEGYGGTLAGLRNRPYNANTSIDNPNGAATRSLTAILRFPAESQVELVVLDPARHRSIELNGQEAMLANNFSTPVARIAADIPNRSMKELKAMLKAEKFEHLRQLHISEPFRRDEIPVVFLHGLQSSPRIWIPTVLAMMQDPRIRENFQFWFYQYPTGYDVAHTAGKFREEFARVMAVNSPEGMTRELNNTVFIGHSMGGLVTSLLVRDGGDQLWNQLSNIPFEQVPFKTIEEREAVRKKAYFKAIPQVSRAVFVATPHRGSNMATSTVGRMGSMFAQAPRRVINLEFLNEGGSILTEQGRLAFFQNFDSIQGLSPDSWMLKTIISLPVNERITYHSIIGRKNLKKPLLESSDGIVPYSSAHLAGAVSEKVIVSDHGVSQTSECIAEVRRILHLHLDGIDE